MTTVVIPPTLETAISPPLPPDSERAIRAVFNSLHRPVRRLYKKEFEEAEGRERAGILREALATERRMDFSNRIFSVLGLIALGAVVNAGLWILGITAIGYEVILGALAFSILLFAALRLKHARKEKKRAEVLGSVFA